MQFCRNSQLLPFAYWSSFRHGQKVDSVPFLPTLFCQSLSLSICLNYIYLSIFKLVIFWKSFWIDVSCWKPKLTVNEDINSIFWLLLYVIRSWKMETRVGFHCLLGWTFVLLPKRRLRLPSLCCSLLIYRLYCIAWGCFWRQEEHAQFHKMDGWCISVTYLFYLTSNYDYIWLVQFWLLQYIMVSFE